LYYVLATKNTEAAYIAPMQVVYSRALPNNAINYSLLCQQV